MLAAVSAEGKDNSGVVYWALNGYGVSAFEIVVNTILVSTVSVSVSVSVLMAGLLSSDNIWDMLKDRAGGIGGQERRRRRGQRGERGGGGRAGGRRREGGGRNEQQQKQPAAAAALRGVSVCHSVACMKLHHHTTLKDLFSLVYFLWGVGVG